MKKPEYPERTTDQLLIYLIINKQKGCCTRNSFTAFNIYRFDVLIIVCAIRYFYALLFQFLNTFVVILTLDLKICKTLENQIIQIKIFI
jgi:hypothetical protein